MTDARGSQARWSAAALLAPTAAAVFTGATAWTLHHSPAPATAAPIAATTQNAPPPANRSVVALQGSVKVDAAKAARLQQTLAALRTQAALRTLAARAGAAPPATTAPAGRVASGLSSAGTAALQTSPVAGGQAAPANPVTQAYAPPAAAAPAQPVTPAPAAPPPPVAQPVPVAAPPVHTTTGASGVKK